jgi:hypothetical protein
MGLSLLFVLAPILVPLSLFGMWGGELFDKYIKTIINLSFWVVIKSALDRVVYEYLVGVHGSSGFDDDLAFMAMVLSYAVMVLTIPFISSYFIGGLNLSPTVAGAAWLQATSKGLLKKAGGAGLNYGKEKGLQAFKNLKPKFSLGGKK